MTDRAQTITERHRIAQERPMTLPVTTNNPPTAHEAHRGAQPVVSLAALDAPPVVQKWARIIAHRIPGYVLDADRDETAFDAAWLIWCTGVGQLYARMAALDDRHRPRTWVGGTATVCDACQTAWPCTERQILDGRSQ